MGRLLKRFLGRHANALSFWAVIALVALALAFGVAMIHGRLR